MSGEALWSVKGIDPRARDAAREAARRAGLSLGDWLNRAILIDGEAAKGDHQTPPSPRPQLRPDPVYVDSVFDARPHEVSSTIQSLDRLAERIETAEARSALAITGIDQSVYALVSRLENAERGQKQYNAKLEGGLHELRATQTAVADRLRRMESDSASSKEDLAALRSLEMALGSLASRVREVEDGALDKDYIDIKLNTIAHQVDFATHEVQRVSGRVDDVAEATQDIKAEVTGTVKDLAERLTNAETVTDAAVRALRATVTDLGERLADSEERQGENSNAMDGRLSSVTETVMRMIDSGREEVAREIAAAFAMLKPGETDAALTDLQTRLAAAERRQLASFERIGSEIDRLANSLDQRLRGLEERNSGSESDAGMVREEMARVVDALDRRVQAVADRDMAAIQKMGEEMARFAGAVDERISGSERLTAEAIIQVGAQVEGVAERLQERQQSAIEDLVQKMRDQDAAANDRLDAALSGVSDRLDTALSGVTQRLDSVERNADHSPLHQALEALSARIRAVEAAPNAKAPSSFDSTSAKASVEPRVSGWGVFDATPASAAPPSGDGLDARSEPNSSRTYEGPYFAGRSEAECEPLDILDIDEPGVLAAVPGAETPGSWDIDCVDVEVAAETSAGVSENDAQPEEVDDLAALIEMLEAASGGQGPADLDDLDVEPADHARRESMAVSDELLLVDDHFSEAALDFTRPEPAQEILPRGYLEDDIEELLLTSEAQAEHAAKTDSNIEEDILELDPELHEAIFGVPRRAKAKPEAKAEAETDAPDEVTSFDDILADELPVSALADVPPQISADRKSGDYLQQARAAALASQSTARRPVRGRTAPVSSGGGALTSAHVLAAAGVAAVAAIGAGTYFGHKLDAENIEQTLAQHAPRMNEVLAAPSVGVSAEPATAELESEASAPQSSGQQFASLSGAPSKKAERFPEAAPTIAPGDSEATAKMAAMVVPSAPGAVPVDAAPLYQKAVESMRGGDAVAGASMLKQAAQQGYAPAQYRLSKAYERGEGVTRNMAEARRWTEKAAKAGNRKAMHDLAVYYAEGEDVRQDYVTAVEWFRKAAEYGLSDSQYNLGVLFEQGLGVSQDESEALYWFEIAGRAGDQDAARRARELESTVAPALVTTALRRADVFQPRKMDPVANGDSGKRNSANVSYLTGQ